MMERKAQYIFKLQKDLERNRIITMSLTSRVVVSHVEKLESCGGDIIAGD